MFENLATKLKQSRVNRGLSRRQVSELLGISVSVLGLYETGERVPSLAVLVKLATAYKVSVDYLLDVRPALEGYLSVDGLNDRQIQAIRYTIDCFRDA